MTWAPTSTLRSILVWLACGFCSSCADYEPVIDPTATEEEEETTMRNGVPPWAMWGNTQTIEITDNNPSGRALISGQLARIAYGRPETWKFFFHSNLIEVRTGSSATLDVYFDLTIGTGRSAVTITEFEHYRYQISSPLSAGQVRYSNSVIGPDRLGTSPATNVLTDMIDNFVAQDVQIGVRAELGALTTQSAVFSVSVGLAPVNHIRPEWFEGEFPGGENAGS